jgi:hypothetical protein
MFCRRTFLKSAAGAPLSLAAAVPPASLSTVRLGEYRVSRLIAGGNTMRGFSHSSLKLSRHMMEYYTAPRIAGFLLHGERHGINTFQSSYSDTVRDGILLAREQGSKIQFICLASNRERDWMEKVMPLKPIAIVHHGGVTDTLFRAGQASKIADFLKAVHDAGVLAGMSSHNPDNLAKAEDAGWETSLYMACFYNMSRTPEELRAMLGGEDVLGEVFVASDPGRMTARIREIRKPCLGFKILAAGRLSEDRESLEAAFRFAYANVKPGDACIVGMYNYFSDEVVEDAELARKYALPT